MDYFDLRIKTPLRIIKGHHYQKKIYWALNEFAEEITRHILSLGNMFVLGEEIYVLMN